MEARGLIEERTNEGPQASEKTGVPAAQMLPAALDFIAEPLFILPALRVPSLHMSLAMS